MATTTTFGEESVSNEVQVGEESVSDEVQAFGFYADKEDFMLALPKVRTVRNCDIDADAIETELESTRRGVPPLPHWMTPPARFRPPAPPIQVVFRPSPPDCGADAMASSSTDPPRTLEEE